MDARAVRIVAIAAQWLLAMGGSWLSLNGLDKPGGALLLLAFAAFGFFLGYSR